MSTLALEHINITVTNAKATAERLCKLFDWHVRWEGSSLAGQGVSVHVGTDDYYLALYSPLEGKMTAPHNSYLQKAGLNHVGLTVEDIDAMEKKVIDAGYKPNNHGDYEPGRRFYFEDEDGIEFEIVSYDKD